MAALSMTRAERLHKLAWFAPLAMLVYGGNAMLVQAPPANLLPADGFAPEWPVLFDLLVLVPMLYLGLFWRDRRRALAGMATLAVAGLVFADWIMPPESRHWLGPLQTGRNLLIAAFVAGEIVLAAGLARLTLGLLREGVDPEQAIARALDARFGDGAVARVLAFEVRMWFYALFASPARALAYAGDEHFSCHAKDGHASNQQGFLLLVLIELPIAHLLLALIWHSTAAWIVTAFSAWGLVFLLGEYRATLRRPISLDADTLYLRYGLSAELQLPIDRIAIARPHAARVARRTEGTLRYCEAGVPNVCLVVEPPISAPGLLGDSRPIREIYLGVDAPARFLDRLDARMACARMHAIPPGHASN